jgi:hypothetical protein
MTSEDKLIANRENAKKSTGPVSPEGKARVAQNSLKHGLRARNAVLLMEENPKFQALLQDLLSEWNPANLTEEDLVEQLAVNKWKLARYEAVESQACTQSTLVHLSLKGPLDYKRIRGAVKPLDIVCKREAQAELGVSRVNQIIARIERSYFRALTFLLRLQDRRLKRQRQEPQPAQAEAAAPHAAPKVRTAGASATATVTPVSAAPALRPVPVCRR